MTLPQGRALVVIICGTVEVLRMSSKSSIVKSIGFPKGGTALSVSDLGGFSHWLRLCK